MARLAVFIDGGYLDYVLRDDFGAAEIDYALLADVITEQVGQKTIGGVDLFRTYYYHCLPYQGNPPTVEESQRLANRRRFYAALERIPRFEVRLGRLAFRGYDQNNKPIFEQKRVDMMLGVDLALLSAKQLITHAAQVAGDSDFLPAVTASKPEGVVVWLVHGPQPHDELWGQVDERLPIGHSLIDRVRRQTRLIT